MKTTKTGGKVIAIATNKGGTGKTTTTVNVGAGLARAGKRVLLIDFDPQASLTNAFFKRGAYWSIATLFRQEIEEAPIKHITDNLDLIPATIDLATTDPKNTKLYGILNRQQVRERYDYTLIDSPPSVGRLLYNVLLAGDELYIPTTPDPFGLQGLQTMEDLLAGLKRHTTATTPAPIAGIICTRYNGRRRLNRAVWEHIQARYTEGVAFNSVIRENIALSEAQLARRDIFDYAPKSNGATDYGNLVAEILKRHK